MLSSAGLAGPLPVFFVRGPIIVSKRLFLRTVIKLLPRMAPRFSILASGTRVLVSENNLNPTALLTSEHGCEAEVIRRILEIEDGDFIDGGANAGQTLPDFYAAVAARGAIPASNPI